MKTITWNQFCGLIESLNIQIEIDGIKPEIYYEDNVSIKFKWECDNLVYEYFAYQDNNEDISVYANVAKIKCRDSNEKDSEVEICFYSAQPHDL